MAPRSRVAMRTLRPFLLPALVAIGSLLVVSMAAAGPPADHFSRPPPARLPGLVAIGSLLVVSGAAAGTPADDSAGPSRVFEVSQATPTPEVPLETAPPLPPPIPPPPHPTSTPF